MWGQHYYRSYILYMYIAKTKFNAWSAVGGLLVHSCVQGEYRKPMELLLSLVDKYWSGEMKDHNTKHFFSE